MYLFHIIIDVVEVEEKEQHIYMSSEAGGQEELMVRIWVFSSDDIDPIFLEVIIHDKVWKGI